MPLETGVAWHQRLIDTVSENRDTAIFQCPMEGSSATAPDFRGPSRDANAARPSDPIAGDKLDNHGDPDRYGVNALTMGYRVLKITRGDAARWADYLGKTRE